MLWDSFSETMKKKFLGLWKVSGVAIISTHCCLTVLGSMEVM